MLLSIAEHKKLHLVGYLYDLHIDYQFNWKSHTVKIIPKLSSVCCAIRKLYFVEIEVLCLVYFANFQSVVDYGVIFWGNSTSPSHIFLLQKSIIRSMVGDSPRCLGRGFSGN